MAFLTELAFFGVGTLVTMLFLHLAASFALGGTPIWRAAIVAVLGNLVGALVLLVFPNFPIIGFVIVLVCWLAITATVYRTTIWKALFIGLFAYLLWVVTRELVRSLLDLMP
jgi:hypothetical protein